MKSLRIACFLSAAYYGLHAVFLYLMGYVTNFQLSAIPQDLFQANPLLFAQAEMGVVGMEFAPYLLIGFGICLLSGFFASRLLSLMPLISCLLLVGTITWAVAYYLQLEPFNQLVRQKISQEGAEMNGVLGSYLNYSLDSSKYAGAYPLFIPAMIIFIFWNKLRKDRKAILSQEA